MADLIKQANKAKNSSYSPYSKFSVGAAVEMKSGKVYTGCNIENASYGLTICAERVAIFNGISSGDTLIKKIAISCQCNENSTSSNMPCGACLQVIAEFSDGDIDIQIEDVGNFKLSELFPKPFKL